MKTTRLTPVSTRSGLPCLLVALAAVLLACTTAMAQRSTPVQVLHPAGAASDFFGKSVAIHGDTMVVGAPNDDVGTNADQGSAHVYRWTGTGWTLEATLTAPDGAASDLFGWSVALSGDTAIVGALADDVGANSDQGSAYVFVRTPGGTTWTQQAKLTASDGAANDSLGYSVALGGAGDTAIVGADYDAVGANTGQGSAYVFVRSGTTWTQQARLTASDGAPYDYFGHSVALSGDNALVGVFADDVGANANQGSAYVFARSGTTWTQQAKLTASDGAANDDFGISVALSEDTAIIGSYLDAVGANANQGSAYVFVRSGTTWTQQTKLTAPDGAASDLFGYSVALSGATAIVAAYSDDVGANADQGSAHVFVRSGTTWTQQAKLTAPDGAASDVFGYSVALSGDMAVVGAYADTVGANPGQGSAWVFSRMGTKWIGPDLKLLASDGAASDFFGHAVALSGDTALVGAPHDYVGAIAEQGSAYVFVRSGTIWTQQAKLAASDGATSDYFGYSVALFGDTAIVGAYNDDVGVNVDQGSAYIFTRSGTAWTQQAKFTASDGAANDQFGWSVALSGDTAIVGAKFDSVGANTLQGSAYVFARSGTTWTQQAKLTASDGATSDLFGYSVALSGDTAVVGAYGDDVGSNADQGSAYAFTRSGASWTQQAKLTASDGAANDVFGNSVALSGDTALVGVPFHDVGANSDQGSTYVFIRSGTTWGQQAQLTAFDGAASDLFGMSVAISGETAIVGANGDDVGGNDTQGSAYVFTRSGASWTQHAKLTASDGATFDTFGSSVALSGDSAFIGNRFANIGANADQGSAWAFDVAYNDFSTVRITANSYSTYDTLNAAIAGASNGHQIVATPAAFREIGVVDTFSKSLSLAGTGPVRTPSTSVIALGAGSSLTAPSGSPIEIFGQLRASASASADVYADSFLLGSRGILTVRDGGSLTFNVPQSSLVGQTRTEADTYLTFNGLLDNGGTLTAAANTTITTSGLLTNSKTISLTGGTINSSLLWNREILNVFENSAVFGSLTNEAGAVTTIRAGTLYIFGSLTNNGTILGAVCSGCRSPLSPGLDVGGTLSIGSAANLVMPFADSVIRVGGSFDCAIDSNTRYDMALATLQLDGSGPEQTLEVMSQDIGPSALGLDRTAAGRYPIGTLHIGSGPSTVRLVDNHDNDGLGQAACEALYVNTLRIDAGSRLINTACKVYYRTLISGGTVDVPTNLIRICPADFNQNGSLQIQDVFDFLNAWFAGDPRADFNGNGLAVQDIFDFLNAWFAGC